jgi:proline racemase
LGLPIEPATVPELIRRGMKIMAAIDEQAPPVHPTNPEINDCRHVQIVQAGTDGADARNAVVIHTGWVDRSPCGTGTSARMAQRHARGLLDLDTDFVNESPIGTRFTGRLTGTTTVGDLPAVLPSVTGRAWITATAQYLLDPEDPFPEGFLI